MKSNMLLGVAVFSLAAMPFGVSAQEENTGMDEVSYLDAMQCSALFTVLGASDEGEEEGQELLDMSARWLVVAMNRDGSDDGSVAEAELEPMVRELIAELEGMESEQDGESFLLEGIDFCDQKAMAISDEFDSIEI